ncbi:hypothetical protein BJ322DRAFT_1207045 [Thelephora terrestris]|uniref:Uncharacterized protein n=1 Tax=Thelephora terrestris TaxID=56493 RepID=A0A9P6LC49_9AGAM|nr:hypothetical protein BJ322DRAFT_1207045 [Thelephora terrestris]
MAIEAFLSTTAQRAFLITITIQAIVVLTLVGLVFAWVDKWVDFNQTMYKTIPCYLALFAFGEVFEILMAVDGLRARNIIQLAGVAIFHGCLIIFSAAQVHETRQALSLLGGCDFNGTTESYIGCSGAGTLFVKVRPLLIAAPCVIAAAWLILLWWTKALFDEFGWAVFHIVGANPTMKKMYRWYQVVICLLKFDFFFFIGVTMQLLILVVAHNSAEFGITITAIPIVLVLLSFAAIAVQREIRWLMSISLVLMLASESYFGTPSNTPIYKLVRIFSPGSESPYETTRVTLALFTICAFLILFATFIVGLRCFGDFDKGLKPSKVHGQSLLPTQIAEKINLMGEYSSFSSHTDINSKPQSPGYSSEPKPDGVYTGGAPLSSRISIE